MMYMYSTVVLGAVRVVLEKLYLLNTFIYYIYKSIAWLQTEEAIRRYIFNRRGSIYITHIDIEPSLCICILRSVNVHVNLTGVNVRKFVHVQTNVYSYKRNKMTSQNSNIYRMKDIKQASCILAQSPRSSLSKFHIPHWAHTGSESRWHLMLFPH